jgi:predicted metal-dependent hydrolase
MEYHLIRSKKRKRTLSLQITVDGKVVIRAPHRTPQSEIDGFFTSRSAWVQKKLLEKDRLAAKPAHEPKTFINGERFRYLGEEYPIEIIDVNHKRSPLFLSFGIFFLVKERQGKARELFVRWYKLQAQKLFAERVGHYSKRFELSPKGIRITSALRRYGSCSPDNRLAFTWRLIMAPLPVIDYVIIHELMHIREKNHSKNFWNLVEAVMPDYKNHRQWLKDNSSTLKI